MTIHQCPKCDLRFDWTTELDDHCRKDHPEFHHDYPARTLPAPPVEHHPLVSPGPSVEKTHIGAGAFFGWLTPEHEHLPEHSDSHEHPPAAS